MSGSCENCQSHSVAVTCAVTGLLQCCDVWFHASRLSGDAQGTIKHISAAVKRNLPVHMFVGLGVRII